jgi:phospholipid transport system substrate-binding protein
MLNRRSLLVSALVLAAAPAGSLWAADAEQGARGFIQSLGAEAIAAFSDKSLNRPQAVERFKNLLHKGFDVPYIGRWVLGRYWNQATPQEQAEYLGLFEGLIVETYANRFAEYSGETLRINGARVEGESDILVQTQITRPSGPPVAVDWRVRPRDGAFRIIDVMVEGVSMGITQRSEFASVIQSSGGVAGLIRALKTRIGQG